MQRTVNACNLSFKASEVGKAVGDFERAALFRRRCRCRRPPRRSDSATAASVATGRGRKRSSACSADLQSLSGAAHRQAVAQGAPPLRLDRRGAILRLPLPAPGSWSRGVAGGRESAMLPDPRGLDARFVVISSKRASAQVVYGALCCAHGRTGSDGSALERADSFVARLSHRHLHHGICLQ